MVTRIGDLAHNTQMSSLLLTAQTRSRATQVQISSGKAAQRFETLAADAERLVTSKNALQQSRRFQSSNELVGLRLVAMETAVGSLHDLADRAQALLMQRLNGVDVAPGAMTAEIRSLLDDAVAHLNTDHAGRYLFGGSRSDAPPVVLDPAFSNFGAADDSYYQGDALERTLVADLDVTLTYGMTADREGFRELIGGLRGFLEGDLLDDDAMLENALGLIGASLDKLADYRGELGQQQARLERINAVHSDAQLYLEKAISDIEDVDVAEAITRFSQDQVLIETAMATIARLNQLSLSDYIN